MSDDDGFVTETWQYAGRRTFGKDHKLIYAWVDSNGRDMLFDKVAGSAIGGLYEVSVKRTGDDGVSARSGTEYTGVLHSGDQVAVWQALDKAARNKAQLAKAERAAARNADSISLAMGHLLRVAQQCKTYEELRALQAVVDRELLLSWDKR